MNNSFSIKESFAFAWHLFKERAWYFIGVAAIVCIIIGVTSHVLAPSSGGNILFTLIEFIIGIFVDMGLVKVALTAHDDLKAAHWKTLWAPKLFWQYAAASILEGVIVIIGFILIIIPGIIAMLGLMFTKYAVMDKGLGPIQALKESWRITKGHRWHLLGFLIATIVLNLIGMICILIGLLVTIPLTALATVHIYRQLESEAHGTAAPAAEAAPIAPAAA